MIFFSFENLNFSVKVILKINLFVILKLSPHKLHIIFNILVPMPYSRLGDK